MGSTVPHHFGILLKRKKTQHTSRPQAEQHSNILFIDLTAMTNKASR